MMPGFTTTRGLVTGPLVHETDMFGDGAAEEPVRVAVQVSLNLSFGELLAFLLCTPGVSLSYGELEDDDSVREAVRFGLLALDATHGEDLSEYAMTLYDSGRQPLGAPEREYTRAAGRAVTRVFGVTA
ncbi:hypothetical protein [Streptomyces sp. NPDC058426]|uniref:hypothetical protein n=1 Tax=Streptomyces sp. NPDC058426 TaxID=3346493 RepID=UPI003647B67B